MTMPLSEQCAILIMPTDRDPSADAIRAWIGHTLDQLPALTTLRAALVADELVTNARRHGRPPYVLHLTVRRNSLVVAVDDSATDDTGPRSLTLVDGLSERWGVDRRPRATTFWAEFGR